MILAEATDPVCLIALSGVPVSLALNVVLGALLYGEKKRLPKKSLR